MPDGDMHEDDKPGVDCEGWKGGRHYRSHLADQGCGCAGRKVATVEEPGHQQAEGKDQRLGGGLANAREGRVRRANAAR